MCFVQARLDPEQVGDEMLPTVGWSWLTEAFEQNGPARRPGRNRDADVVGALRRHRRPPPHRRRGAAGLMDPGLAESDGDLRRHAEAFCTLVSTAAGLPPVGIAQLAR